MLIALLMIDIICVPIFFKFNLIFHFKTMFTTVFKRLTALSFGVIGVTAIYTGYERRQSREKLYQNYIIPINKDRMIKNLESKKYGQFGQSLIFAINEEHPNNELHLILSNTINKLKVILGENSFIPQKNNIHSTFISIILPRHSEKKFNQKWLNSKQSILNAVNYVVTEIREFKKTNNLSMILNDIKIRESGNILFEFVPENEAGKALFIRIKQSLLKDYSDVIEIKNFKKEQFTNMMVVIGYMHECDNVNNDFLSRKQVENILLESKKQIEKHQPFELSEINLVNYQARTLFDATICQTYSLQ
eukprot:393307_1